MKYTFLGFSQKAACELGLDVTDLVILRWFVDFKDSGKMHSVSIDNEEYYWIFYKNLLEDMCILSLCRETLYRRLKKMCDKNILKKKKVAYGGNYTYYALGENYIKLNENSENFSRNDTISNRMGDNLSINSLDFNQDYHNISRNGDNLSHNPDALSSNTVDLNHNHDKLSTKTADLNRNYMDLNPKLSDENSNQTYHTQNQTDRKPEQITNLLNKSTNINKTTNEITPEFFLSELLVKLIQKNNPNFKKTNLDDWEEDFKLILYEDNKHYMEVIHLLRWAHLEAKIWSKVIDSPLALRKHYDALYANREAVKANNGHVKKQPWELFE
ncbi:MAG: hypothetical protein Q4E31_13200 [Intestinibacter bartlettii]|uniref:hypothetical protein n=1 Tax=Intestinibacter bartlettii TaxID=261299 RepID=UPI0026EE4C8E|nr:hypothetical protein [Intestinibacter bartlettii]MDO5011777.1 hypothetical protein [Intestinibacter bartlettii]